MTRPPQAHDRRRQAPGAGTDTTRFETLRWGGAAGRMRFRTKLGLVRIDYDREARHYRAGREVPLEQLEPWRPFLAAFLGPGDEPLLDVGAGTGLWTRAFVTWFHADVIALEPSCGMRKVGTEIGLPLRASYVAASAEHLPFGRAAIRAAWLSTVVHHLTDISACARELRRALAEGAR